MASASEAPTLRSAESSGFPAEYRPLARARAARTPGPALTRTPRQSGDEKNKFGAQQPAVPRGLCPRGRSAHPDGGSPRRAPPPLLKAGRGPVSHLVLALQKVPWESQSAGVTGWGRWRQQLRGKRTVDTSGAREDPNPTPSAPSTELPPLSSSYSGAPLGPRRGGAGRVEPLASAPQPRVRPASLPGRPRSPPPPLLLKHPGLLVPFACPRPVEEQSSAETPPAGLSRPSAGTRRQGAGKGTVPRAPWTRLPLHFVDGRRLRFYFI